MDAALKKMIEEEKTILAGFEASAEKYPDRPTLIFLGTRFSYRELKDLTWRFAAAGGVRRSEACLARRKQ